MKLFADVETTTVMPAHFWADYLSAFAFGLLLIFLMFLGYKSIDLALRKLDFDEELRKGNVAVAIFASEIIIGVSYGISNIIVAILH